MAIDELRRGKHEKVLYIDLDLHHGDGVEMAYNSTSNVLTLSIHLFAPLFYPSTGALKDVGKSKYHSLNVATNAGLSDSSFERLFESCIRPILSIYPAPVICVQCGVDGLAGDPCKEWNLSLAGYFVVLKGILVTAQENNQKVLLLGGGGYQNSISARAYTYLTSIALGQELDLNSSIPDSVKDYDSFAPSFTLDVEAGNRIDENSEVKLVEIENQFAIYIKELQKLYTIPTKSDA